MTVTIEPFVGRSFYKTEQRLLKKFTFQFTDKASHMYDTSKVYDLLSEEKSPCGGFSIFKESADD